MLRQTTMLVAIALAAAASAMELINFDDVPIGPVGTQYLSRGVMFYDGNGMEGASTGILYDGGQPVTAFVYPGWPCSPPYVLVPWPGSDNDIIVQFFDGKGARTVASTVGISNDAEALPRVIRIEGFDQYNKSLGFTEIVGPCVPGFFSAPGIYWAKIYGVPGQGEYLGVDDFRYQIAPEPATSFLLATGLAGFAVLRRKCRG